MLPPSCDMCPADQRFDCPCAQRCSTEAISDEPNAEYPPCPSDPLRLRHHTRGRHSRAAFQRRCFGLRLPRHGTSAANQEGRYLGHSVSRSACRRHRQSALCRNDDHFRSPSSHVHPKHCLLHGTRSSYGDRCRAVRRQNLCNARAFVCQSARSSRHGRCTFRNRCRQCVSKKFLA